MNQVTREKIKEIQNTILLINVDEGDRLDKESKRKALKLLDEIAGAKEDRRIFNTRLLLRNYHNFKNRCDELKESNKVETEEDPFLEIAGEYLSVESLTRSSARTMNMMNFIDKMLEFYKSDCERQGKEAMRKYNTLMHFYIYEDKKTYEEIAELHQLNERTVRRDLKDAVHALAVLIFGIDGLRIQL
ncbi:hypothetical protein AAHH17_12445 [Lysinibacillus capsici]|uniref:hypothetical protein n=1 Tax=Lysinibacillus capsici TaxID=2115968 RepID=UPI0032E3A520